MVGDRMIKQQSLYCAVNNELKEFSNYDNVRSIPKVIDGLKDSQRKCVYGMLKYGNKELKVSQLAEYVSMATDYQHGSASLGGTIVGLAQDYPGTNNINLFEPIGQFGNILNSTPAATRYIFTKPTVELNKLIREEDNDILEYRYEDGAKLEPVYYLPLIPFWAVNGSRGIGTGHSTNVQTRSLEDIKGIITKLIKTPVVKVSDPLPHYNKWKGKVEATGQDNQYLLTGCYEIVNTTTIKVTELPIGYDIDKYKAILIKLMDENVVRDFDNNSTEEGFEFIITVPREVTRRSEDDIIKTFKLQQKVTENITLWSTDGVLQRYDSIVDALREAVQFRLSKYTDRKKSMLDKLNTKLEWLTHRKIFITYWLTKMKEPQKKTINQLKTEIHKETKIPKESVDRLLEMRLSSLSLEMVDKLDKDIVQLEKDISILEGKTIEQLYLDELKDL